MLRTTLTCALGAAALLAPASAQATTVKGSGSYDFGNPYIGTVKVDAKSQAAGASGTIKIRIPRYVEPKWHRVEARVTCLRTSGNRAFMTARVTRVSADPEVYRYLTLITEPQGVYASMADRPHSCSQEPCRGPCPLAPLVGGKGIAPRR